MRGPFFRELRVDVTARSTPGCRQLALGDIRLGVNRGGSMHHESAFSRRRSAVLIGLALGLTAIPLACASDEGDSTFEPRGTDEQVETLVQELSEGQVTLNGNASPPCSGELHGVRAKICERLCARIDDRWNALACCEGDTRRCNVLGLVADRVGCDTPGCGPANDCEELGRPGTCATGPSSCPAERRFSFLGGNPECPENPDAFDGTCCIAPECETVNGVGICTPEDACPYSHLATSPQAGCVDGYECCQFVSHTGAL
jgi:hypothetical protein